MGTAWKERSVQVGTGLSRMLQTRGEEKICKVAGLFQFAARGPPSFPVPVRIYHS